MPNWTDDEGKSWFNRCEECGEMKNDKFNCVNVKCTNYYETSRAAQDASEDFLELPICPICNVLHYADDFDDEDF